MRNCICNKNKNPTGNLRLPPALLAICSSLVASNCCILQLILNFFSIGCAGFAILDPLRPYARTATVASVVYMMLTRSGRTKRSSWMISAISLLLLTSQDMIALYNKGGRPAAWFLRFVAWRHMTLYSSTRMEEVFAPKMDEAGTDLLTKSIRGSDEGGGESQVACYRFRVAGIKCEGCAARLKTSLEAAPGVMAAYVDFLSKEVTIEALAGVESEAIRHAIRAVDLTYVPDELIPGSNSCKDARIMQAR